MEDILPVPLSEITKSFSTYIYKIATSEPQLGNVFNMIKPTTDVPFVSWNNISKIHRDFNTSKARLSIQKQIFDSFDFNKDNKIDAYDLENYWYFKGQDTSKSRIDEFIQTHGTGNSVSFNEFAISYPIVHKAKDTILVKYKKADGVGWGEATIQITGGNKVIIAFIIERTPVDTVKEYFNAIGINLEYDTEQNIVSQFNIPNQTITQYIFLDMILNDSLFIKYLSIDESYQTKKGFLTVRFHPTNKQASDFIVFTLTEQVSNTRYLRVKLKGYQTNDQINELRDVLSKLISHYNNNIEKISSIYSDLGIKIIEDKRKKINTKDVNQLAGQSRQCQNYNRPIQYMTEALALDASETGNTVMKFPKDGDNRVGYEQRFYACERGKFPGLTKPPADKSSDIGVPCCYTAKQDDRTNTKQSPLEIYLHGYDIARNKNKITTPHVLGDTKPLKNNQQGKLPDMLNRKFAKAILNTDALHRNGVDMEPKSLSKCISSATKQMINLEDIGSKPHLARQEMYDYSMHEISEMILDDNIVMDGKLLVSLFEEVLGINIFIFNKDGIVIPRHSHGYFKRKNKYNSIMVYENMIGDKLQYDLISQVRRRETVASEFEFGSAMSNLLMEFFNSKVNITINGKETNRLTDFDIPNGEIIIGQTFDAYGKTRVLQLTNTTTKEIRMIHTKPLQPYDIGEINIPSRNITDMNLDYDVTYTFDDPSPLRMYIKAKRLARYLEDYIFWLFMKYKYSDIDKFINDKIEVDTEYVYKGIQKKFNETSGIMRNGKIIINDEDILKRIHFILSITRTRNNSKIVSYDSLNIIPVYFKNITDFRNNLSTDVNNFIDNESYAYGTYSGDNAVM
jgi:hypothetical protein